MESRRNAEPIFEPDDDAASASTDDESLPVVDAPEAAHAVVASAHLSTDPDLEVAYEYFKERAADFGPAIRQALDEVIASGRTRRWNLDQCNNQEKAYVGVNLENVLRQKFDLSHGLLGMDFDISGIDVDCKWSRNYGGWQIPKEATGHICLLVHGDDLANTMAVGVIRIREDILVGGNRDLKRTIQRPEGLSSVRWIIADGESALPENFLMSISKADREAILGPRGGNARAIELFRRCEGLIIHRRVIEAIGQQVDDARRFRGEVRAELARQGFEVLNGHWKSHRARARELGGLDIAGHTQWVALRTDGSTPARRAELDPVRRREADAFRREMIAGLAEISRRRSAQRKAAKAARVTLAEAVAEAAAVEREVRAAFAIAESAATSLPQRE